MREGRKGGREKRGSSLEGGKNGRKGGKEEGRERGREGRRKGEREEGKRKGGGRGTYFRHLRMTHVFVDDHALHKCSFF